MRSLIPHMGRISGVLLVVSGLVAIYYGWYEARILTGGDPDNALAETISGWRDSVVRWITDIGEERVGIAVAVIVVAALALRAVLRKGTTSAEVGVTAVESRD